MRTIGAGLLVVFALALPLAAQERGRHGHRSQGIPPGHLPPAGACRVWYSGRPPGHQPPPTSCREAERIAARDRTARVIYGDDRRNGRDDDRRATSRYPFPNQSRYPDRYPSTDRNGRTSDRVPFNNGYADGYNAGQEDVRRNRSHDPSRESDYRAASRGYDPRYGSRAEYRDRYREGFRAGYDDAYYATGTQQRGGWRFPWPF